MNKEVDVCIVGAGPGGALLTYLLAKKDISVLLLERTGQIAKAFRGEHINEEGEAVLKKHNLFHAVEKLGLLRMEQLEYWKNGQLIKTILPSPAAGHLGIHVPQAHLLQAILDAAQAYESFQYCLNSRVTDLLQDTDGHYTGVRAVHDREEFTISSKLIVGADGRYSTIRKKAHIKTDVRKHGYDLLWARIPAPPGWLPSIKMTLVREMQVSLFSQTNGYIQIGWNIPVGSYSLLQKQPFSPFVEALIEAFPELTETIDQYITSWRDFVLLDVFSSQAENWGHNGLALIGDAAHAMTPTGAFGLNSAMKDADILAELLKKQTIDHINLLACATERKQEIEKLQALQIEKEQGFSSQFAIMG
ncbi:FAD-dependent monooxygenase [Lysinibacillus odysseyi]|uniref:FAD-binding protein n=1 Tax=Lysinibacillus odysseyi 34hs-1 = NBRC 100172 TaxID=1220589 RepID=A0A0A3JKB0_9BACI|nr:FAD-dependent monooxygenase [Lysinibacillus odysseyi]KGR87432.1 FAD-binding protein [Lysinibacillus odysseyi 34hs-1 = NBRC 100172]